MNYEVYFEDNCLCIKIDGELEYIEPISWEDYKKILPYFIQDN